MKHSILDNIFGRVYHLNAQESLSKPEKSFVPLSALSGKNIVNKN